MTFLAPIFWFASAVAVPVVLFYLIREHPRRQITSTLLFWEDLNPRVHESPLWRKLRRWLSLLLQLLFVVLVVLALTRPQLPWQNAQAQPQILVIDASASMAATDVAPSRFENALDLVREKIRHTRGSTETAILLTGPEPRILSGWTRSKKRLLESLSDLTVSSTGLDPRPTLELAKNLLASRGTGTLHFYTDGVWDAPLSELPSATWHQVGSPAHNTGITSFSARRSLAAPGEVHLLAEILHAQTPVTVELYRNGNLADAIEISPDTENLWKKTWVFQNDTPSEFELRLTGTGVDALATDNKAHLKVPPLETIEVVLVSPEDGFLESAFQAIPNVNVTRIWPADSFKYGDPSKLWVFRDAVPAEDFKARAMLLLSPSTGGFFGSMVGPMKDPMVTGGNKEADPVKFTSFDQVVASDATEFLPAPGATTFVSSFERPLVFGRWEAPMPWLVVAFDMEKSDFVLRSAFPVLMSNIVQSLRGDRETPLKALLPGPAATSLIPSPLLATSTTADEWLSPASLLTHPLWWWLLLAAAVWCFLEWWTFHRRVTE